MQKGSIDQKKFFEAFHFPLSTFYFSLFTFYFSLCTFYFSLFTFYFSLFTFYFSLCTYGQASLQRFEYERPLMGTAFKLVFYASTEDLAKQASDSTFRRIEYLNGILSDYLDSSEVNRLSSLAGSGKYISVSKDLFSVLEKSQSLSRQTNGAFDVSIGAVVQLWRRAIRRGEYPSKAALKAAQKTVSWKKIHLDPNNQSVNLSQRSTRLDFGGIGKGYAADQALGVLRYFGISSALIDAGGDLTLGDAPPHKTGWEIEISSGGGDTIATKHVLLARCGVATSGHTYRYLMHKGRRYSHIVHPRTGVGLTTHTRTTVIAPDGTTADALATAFSVLGIQKGRKIASQWPQIAVWLIEAEGQQWKTESFP
ncbi:MAG: FAD:protein FMN transferase [Runella sp.]